jgi:hypothetical protein
MRIAQECDCEFIDAETSVFISDLINEYLINVVEPLRNSAWVLPAGTIEFLATACRRCQPKWSDFAALSLGRNWPKADASATDNRGSFRGQSGHPD